MDRFCCLSLSLSPLSERYSVPSHTCPVDVKTMNDVGVAACCTTAPSTCGFSICTHTGELSGKFGKDLIQCCLL